MEKRVVDISVNKPKKQGTADSFWGEEANKKGFPHLFTRSTALMIHLEGKMPGDRYK